jgi:hypothetical protein
MRSAWCLVAAGCGGAAIENPTGDCEVPGTGDIACYSHAAPGDQWMPDCDHPLDRYYWRVFAQGGPDDATAYLMPRPDAAGLTWGTCDDPELGPLFDRYHLCDPVLDAAGVEAVNAMALDDALAIAHALHERLVFAPVGSGSSWGVTPWAFPEDLRDACPATGDADLEAACADYVDAVCGPTDLGMTLALDESQATALAAELNRLYGIAAR